MRFEACAHTYDEHAGPQRFFAERAAQFIDAKPTETILELGAGTGALTRLLSGKAILATDGSAKMVQVGRAAAPHAQWLVWDAFQKWIPNASLQVSSGLLHWAKDPAATIFRWKDHLLPGGRMVHAMPCEPCLAEWRAFVPESPVPWRSEAEWLQIFERAGLRITRSQSWTHAAICSSALEMVRGFHRTGVTGRVRVGPAQLRRALQAYDARHRMLGGVQATWAWLAVEAVPHSDGR